MRSTSDTQNQSSKQPQQPSSLIAAGLLIGMGFAGFFDSIVLHQILQWHHMLTSVRPITNIGNLEVNTLWDGFFNAVVYAMTLAGVGFLWRAGQQGNVPGSEKSFGGSLLLGLGGFNLIEGLIDHHLLGIHHVKSGPNQLAWDLGFLLTGASLAVVGWIVLQSGQRPITTPEVDEYK
jgi:uncharacterized membrane protein